MSEDDLILVLFYVIYWITLGILFRVNSNKKRVLNVNLTVQGIYSVILLFSYKNDGGGGAILAVLVVWLATLCVHWLVNILQMVLIIVKKYSNRR